MPASLVKLTSTLGLHKFGGVGCWWRGGWECIKEDGRVPGRGHRNERQRVFNVGGTLGGQKKRGCFILGMQAIRHDISIAHVLGVVHTKNTKQKGAPRQCRWRRRLYITTIASRAILIIFFCKCSICGCLFQHKKVETVCLRSTHWKCQLLNGILLFSSQLLSFWLSMRCTQIRSFPLPLFPQPKSRPLRSFTHPSSHINNSNINPGSTRSSPPVSATPTPRHH